MNTRRLLNRYYDPINGLIPIPAHCKELINEPLFERLQNVMQLGMTSCIFSNGTHSRYEHSIGVMYISGVLYDNIITNSPEYREYADMKKLIEIAALMHDVGHGPKSHLFEEALKLKGIKFCHEEQSLKIFKFLNNKISLLDDEEEKIVCAIIKGEKLEGYPPFLFEIVANKDSGLDTDKMDYLQRDVYHVFKETPLQKTKYEINVLKIINSAKIDAEGHICYAKEVYNDIFHIFVTRYNMYKDIYFHPEIVQNFNRMMDCGLQDITFNFNSLEDFIKYDDDYLLKELKEVRRDIACCFETNIYNHDCERCPPMKEIKKMKQPALSGDTNGNPMPFIKFY